ncbi:MAG TPA: hypothetical protein VJ808_03465 [Gemmatimonadales bacterium]|nr:hypothetical protein [Gemmatimonadales bacterium]
MRRPSAISALAILLIVLAIAASVLAMTAEVLAEVGVKWRLVQFTAMIHGLTAAVAAYGLWRMRRWGYLAFVAWVAAVLLSGLSWPLMYPASTAPWWIAPVWIAVVAAIMTPLARSIKKVIAPAASA